MPIYEYQCEGCRGRIEVMQRFSDPPLTQCECGGRLRKILSPPAIIFKGTGWHITDYARKDKPGGNDDHGGEADQASKTAAKSEQASAGSGEGKN